MPTYNDLRDAVLAWWEVLACDVTVGGDGDEYNVVYDEVPEFVQIAIKLSRNK